MIMSHYRTSKSIYFNNYDNIFCCDLIKNRDKTNKINYIKVVRITLFTSHVIESNRKLTSQYAFSFSTAICNMQYLGLCYSNP